MKFRVEGEDYEFDESTLTVAEARLIKKHTGMGLKSFAESSKDGDPDALVAIVFLAKRRANEAVRWQDLDNLDLAKLEAIDETVPPDSFAPFLTCPKCALHGAHLAERSGKQWKRTCIGCEHAWVEQDTDDANPRWPTGETPRDE